MVESLGLSMYSIMSYANSDSFISSLPIWMPFIYFPCLIDTAKTSRLCWIKGARVDTLVLFLILEEKLSVFHHWVWYQLWVFNIRPLLCWCMFPLNPFCWKFLLQMDVEFCWMLFLHLWRWSFDFYSSFCLCGASQWLIYGYWTILAFPEWVPLIVVNDTFNVLFNAIC